jgi:hypothetical protein
VALNPPHRFTGNECFMREPRIMSKKPRFLHADSLSGEQLIALRRVLSGQDANAVVAMTPEQYAEVTKSPNRLFGAQINDKGEAV